MLPYRSGKCQVLAKYGFRKNPADRTQEIFNGGLILRGISTCRGARDVVVSVSDGTVIRSRCISNTNDLDWKMGNYVAVRGDDGITVYYCHLRNRSVHVGQRVQAGDLIGHEGMTGDVEERQLYLECRQNHNRINAAQYLGVKNANGVINELTYEELCVDEKDERRFRKGNLVTIGAYAKTMSGKKIPADIRKNIFTVLRSQNQCALLKELWEWVPFEYLTKVDKRKLKK